VTLSTTWSFADGTGHIRNNADTIAPRHRIETYAMANLSLNGTFVRIKPPACGAVPTACSRPAAAGARR